MPEVARCKWCYKSDQLRYGPYCSEFCRDEARKRPYTRMEFEDAECYRDAIRANFTRMLLAKQLTGFQYNELCEELEKQSKKDKARLYVTMCRLQDKDALRKQNSTGVPTGNPISMGELRQRLSHSCTQVKVQG